MQGRTGKALKKELVIESPQQFKYVPVPEDEQDDSSPQRKVSRSHTLTHTPRSLRITPGRGRV